MRTLSSSIIVTLTLILGACAINASRTFTVDVSPISVQYTPRQIREFLIQRGFERVAFERAEDSRAAPVLQVRTAEYDEQHFRLTSAPNIQVIVRLEKSRRFIGSSNPRVIVRFIENGHNSLSATAQRHYERLLAQVIEQVGADAVRQ